MHKYLFNTIFILAIVAAMINFSSCDDDDEKETVPATFEMDSTDNNNPTFWSTSSTSNEDLILIYSWDFGNGQYSSDSAPSDLPNYNFPASYFITFTVTTSEGVADGDTMTYKVNNINPDLVEDPYLNNLCINSNDMSDTKEWILSSKDGHISTGPSDAINNGGTADYLNDPIVEEEFLAEDYFKTNADSGIYAYTNAMSFTLEQFIYKNIGPEKWLTNWYFANSEFGYNQEPGKDICIDITTGLDTAGYYRITEEDDATVFLEFSSKNFMLYYEGKPSKTKYQVLALYEDLMVIRRLYFDNDGLPAGYRYLRYVPIANKELALPDESNKSAIDPPSEH